MWVIVVTPCIVNNRRYDVISGVKPLETPPPGHYPQSKFSEYNNCGM